MEDWKEYFALAQLESAKPSVRSSTSANHLCYACPIIWRLNTCPSVRQRASASRPLLRCERGMDAFRPPPTTMRRKTPSIGLGRPPSLLPPSIASTTVPPLAQAITVRQGYVLPPMEVAHCFISMLQELCGRHAVNARATASLNNVLPRLLSEHSLAVRPASGGRERADCTCWPRFPVQ